MLNPIRPQFVAPIKTTLMQDMEMTPATLRYQELALQVLVTLLFWLGEYFRVYNEVIRPQVLLK